MVKSWLTLSFLAAVAAPAAQAFVPAAQMPEIARAPALRSASVLMCLPPAGVRPAAGGIAVAAGAAGFGSVLLLRKGGKKDSAQEWADGKQKEWKVRVFFLIEPESVNIVNDSYNIGVHYFIQNT